MKLKILHAAAAAALLLCASCRNPADSVSASPGSLSVAVSGSARTILPSDMAIVSYRASGAGPLGASIPATTSASGSFSFAGLESGAWTVSVDGLDSAGNVLASGSASATVSLGETASATVRLANSASGSGSVSLSASWPAAQPVAAVSGSLERMGGGSTPVSFIVSGSSASWSASVAAGTYILTVDFLNAGGAELTSPWSETVLVYPAKTSSGNLDLAAADFGGVIYHENGASSGRVVPDLRTYTTGAAVTVAGNPGSLAKAGYIFTGWNTAADGSGTNYPAGSTFSMPASPQHLYAIYVPDTWMSVSGTTLSAGTVKPTGVLMVPPGITAIAASCFNSCTGLTSVYLPASVAGIGSGAFGSCSGLTTVSLNSGLASIGGGAFDRCVRVPSLSIPASVTAIGYGAFGAMRSLVSLSVAGGTSFKAVGGVLFDYAGTTLIAYPAGKSGAYTVPAGTTALAPNAFYGASLSGVTLPSSVSILGDSCFYLCDSLTSANLGSSAVASLPDYAFAYSALDSLTLPSTLIGIGAYAFLSTTGALAFPSIPNVTSLGFACFENSNITSITIPAGVSTVPQEACYGCANLSTLTLSSGVQTIGNRAFQYCSKLGNFTFPSSVKTVGDSAFQEVGILALTIPDTITSLGTYAFAVCPKLASVVFSSNSGAGTAVGDHAFDGCGALTLVGQSTRLASIGDFAFAYCYALNTYDTYMAAPSPCGANVFFDAAGTFKINLMASSCLAAYSAASGWRDYLGALVQK